MYMGEEDVCDTGLALSLGYGGHRRVDNQSIDHLRSERSLTLSLSDDDALKVEAKKESDDTHSTVSSFSTVYPTSLKREIDVALNDTEVERANSSRASDEEEDGGARKKLRLTKEQSALLEDRFKEHSTLNPKQKQALAKQLHLRPRQVEVWFQNRRARTKLKQTEVDCEFLKRCCENLTDENRRLHKEIQELRALKFASSPPLYMQTLTMCPSCERIGGGGADKGGNAAGFVLASNPKGGHFFSPFTGHQAAC